MATLNELTRPQPGGPDFGARLQRSLRRALERSRDGMFLVEGGRIRIGNRFLSEWGGYRGEEVDGTCLASFFDPRTMAMVETLCRSAENGRPQEKISAVMVRKDGGRVAVGLKADGCRFDGRSCALVIVEPLESMTRATGRWDGDVAECFVSEEALCTPACG